MMEIVGMGGMLTVLLVQLCRALRAQRPSLPSWLLLVICAMIVCLFAFVPLHAQPVANVFRAHAR